MVKICSFPASRRAKPNAAADGALSAAQIPCDRLLAVLVLCLVYTPHAALRLQRVAGASTGCAVVSDGVTTAASVLVTSTLAVVVVFGTIPQAVPTAVVVFTAWHLGRGLATDTGNGPGAIALWRLASWACAFTFPLWLLPAVRPTEVAHVLEAVFSAPAATPTQLDADLVTEALRRLSGVWLVLLFAALAASRELPSGGRWPELRSFFRRHLVLGVCGLLAIHSAASALAALLAALVVLNTPSAPQARAQQLATASLALLTLCMWGCAALILGVCLLAEEPGRWRVATSRAEREANGASERATWRAATMLLVAEVASLAVLGVKRQRLALRGGGGAPLDAAPRSRGVTRRP